MNWYGLDRFGLGWGPVEGGAALVNMVMTFRIHKML
jgi:hypothetical protein